MLLGSWERLRELDSVGADRTPAAIVFSASAYSGSFRLLWSWDGGS